jgi:hypothetical protein
MAANVINSPQAIKMSVFVVRAFVRLRNTLAVNLDLSEKLDDLEKKAGKHDDAIKSIITAIRQLMQT